MRYAANAALAVLILALLAVASTVTAIPALTGTIPVSIVAGSMTGTYDFGTIVYVDPKVTPTVGSVVTWKAGANSPVTHRIVAIQPDPSGNGIEYITRGDFNATNDAQPVPPSYVVGVVTSAIPYAGLATGLLDKFPVQVFLACIALTLYWLSNKQPSAVPSASGLVGEIGQ